MKQLPRVCCVMTLVLMTTACSSVPRTQRSFINFDIDAETYIARAGDTLESVAFRYKVSPSELAALNPSVPRNLPAGTELRIRSDSRWGSTYEAQVDWPQAEPEPLVPIPQRSRAYTTPVETPDIDTNVTYEPLQRAEQDNLYQEKARLLAESRRLEEIRRQEADQLYQAEATRLEQARLREEEAARQLERTRQEAELRQLQEARRYSELQRLEESRRFEDTPSIPAPVNGVVPDVALLESRNAYPSTGSPNLDAYRSQQRDTEILSGRNEVVEEVFDAGSVEMGASTLSGPALQMSGRWTWPTQGEIARSFSPVTEGRHGVDIAGVPGQPVVAAMDGVVAYSGKDPSGSGNLIIVKHSDSLLSAYSHTQDLYVAENDTVTAGDPIGTLGWNSRQESVLRFEVREDGNSLNPMNFLSAR